MLLSKVIHELVDLLQHGDVEVSLVHQSHVFQIKSIGGCFVPSYKLDSGSTSKSVRCEVLGDVQISFDPDQGDRLDVKHDRNINMKELEVNKRRSAK